jgi:hypothetical protein
MNDLITSKTVDGFGFLEPRLQEYAKRKKMYKKNNIQPCVPLEKEFGITNDDIKKINKYYKMQKNGHQREYRDQNVVDISGATQITSSLLDEQFTDGFLADTLKDKRIDKMKSKHKNDKKINESKKREFGKKFTNDTEGLGWLEDDEIIDGRYFQQNDTIESTISNCRSGFRGNGFTQDDYNNNKEIMGNYSKRTYKNVEPTIYYKSKLHDKDSLRSSVYTENTNKIIGEYDTYRKRVYPNFEQSSEFDTANKINIPYLTSNNKKNINTCDYKSMPYMGFGGNEPRNTYNETILLRGQPDKTSKSFGYSNPFEHYFDYISNEIQEPEHTILPFPRGGAGTRSLNRENGEPYYRSVS